MTTLLTEPIASALIVLGEVGHATMTDELCGRYSVRRLALFGSAVRDDFDSDRSDLDFLVDFEPLPPVRHADACFGLLADLEALFDRPIDLVESAALRNAYRRREIEATQVLVHGAARPAGAPVRYRRCATIPP